MSGHTPGPWLGGCGPDGKPLIFQNALWEGIESVPEWKANARLMDAAPDLLVAAKRTVAAFEDANTIRGKDDDYIYDTLGSMQAAAYFAARDALDKVRL